MAYLNYDIGPDVLNRIKGAYAPIDKNIGKIGDDLSKRAKEYSDEKYKQWKEEEDGERGDEQHASGAIRHLRQAQALLKKMSSAVAQL